MATYLQVADWAQLQRFATQVRYAVFVHEQGVPAELELDADDDTALHAVLFDTDGMALGTARLLQPEAGVAKVGRMAVLSTHRRRGLGQRLLKAMVSTARRRGDREVWLSAQRQVEGFYAQFGFQAVGDPYDEVGIAHIAMRLSWVD